MDDRRFDALARSLGATSSRRGTLAALAAIGLAAGGPPPIVEAGKKRRCKKDSPPGQCCKHGTCTCKNGGKV